MTGSGDNVSIARKYCCHL